MRRVMLYVNHSNKRHNYPIYPKCLVNPIVRQEQYPQPKVRTNGINIDIKPSELDMLTKLKDDNTKMFIIQLLNAKAIGFDTLKKGTADQQAKVQKAYDVYEIDMSIYFVIV